MPASSKRYELDWSAFPPGMVNEYTTHLCLACIFKIFTGQLGLAPRTAYSEIKRHAPTISRAPAETRGNHSRPASNMAADADTDAASRPLTLETAR